MVGVRARLPAGDLFEPRRTGRAHRAQVRPAQVQSPPDRQCQLVDLQGRCAGLARFVPRDGGKLEAVIARLEVAGIPIVAGPAPRSGALGPTTSIYCEDPDGNLVEVSTYARDPVA